MNGLKSLVLQDLIHVLPSRSFPILRKLSACNLHTAVSSRRFWNFFEFANKDEVPRDSEQCQVSKDIVPPEQIAGEMGDIGKIPQSANTVTSVASMSINPRIQGYQQQQQHLPMSCWNASQPLKGDSLMSLLDGNSVPKTMKWKLKGYKTLRRHQTDEFAFVPGGIYDFDVDLLSDVKKVTKNEFAAASLCPGRGARAKSEEAPKKDIILSTKAIEAKDHSRVTPSSETVQMKNTGTTKPKEAMQKLPLGETKNADQPAKTPAKTPAKPASASGLKVPVAQKLLSLPKAEQIKFLPISKPEVPTVSMKCQSQPTARYSSQPPDNSLKPPLDKPRLAKTTDNEGMRLDRRETSQPPDTYSIAPQQSSSARSEETRTTETVSNVREHPMEAEPAKPTDDDYHQPERLETEMDAVDLYQNRMENNRRVFAKGTEPRTPKYAEPTDFAPGPWRRNDDGQTRFQGRSNQTSLNNVYEAMGIPPKEGPPLKIVGPDQKQLGTTSPCAATQAKLQQNGGNASQQQQGSFSYDGGSSMAGNGGGSRKPPALYPPFTSRRSSSSKSSAPVKPLERSSRTMNISTTSRRPAPKKCDNDDEGQMIEGKTICTKPRENKCSRQRDDCQKKPKKQCKRYCCPALQVPPECDWSKSDCSKKSVEKKIDPTCLPPESEAKQGKEACTTSRRSSARRERNNNNSCNKSSSPRPRCKRERRSCERRERSCEKQEKRQCDREQGGREICTNPRRRDSCERRRDSSDRDCNRKATKCNGRRSYTQSAYTRRPHARKNINRFFSMSTMGFSLIGMNRQQPRNTLFRIPSANRFYGKDSSNKTTCCKTEKKKCKKPPAKCLERKQSGSKCKPEPKCKIETKSKIESKCKIETKSKIETKCKTGTKSKELEKKCSTTKKNPCQTSSGKSKKKESPCKTTTSQGDQCAKRRQQMCKNAKSSPEKDDGTKQRADRERKEIQECKKNITFPDKKGKQEKKKAMTGLDRVISPCKPQSGKGSSGCGKASCAAAPLNRLANSSLFLNADNDLTGNGVSDRLFSTVKFHQSDHYDVGNTSDSPRNHYTTFDDDVHDDSGTIMNIHQQQAGDTTNNSSTINNWFLSWFHS